MDAGLFAGALLGSGWSKAYDGRYEQLLHGYGHDVMMPFCSYFLNRFLGIGSAKNRWLNAAYAVVGCSAFEVMQAFGSYPGTFDPKDFLAYAVGAGAAIGLDVVLENTARVSTARQISPGEQTRPADSGLSA